MTNPESTLTPNFHFVPSMNVIINFFFTFIVHYTFIVHHCSQAIILILEGDHSADVKEQALCILANIADGNTAKTAIMSNEDVLKKLRNYMVC